MVFLSLGSVDLERRQLLHQVVQVVEDTLDLRQDVLSLHLLLCCLAAAPRFHPDAVELHAGALGGARLAFRCLKPSQGSDLSSSHQPDNAHKLLLTYEIKKAQRIS